MKTLRAHIKSLKDCPNHKLLDKTSLEDFKTYFAAASKRNSKYNLQQYKDYWIEYFEATLDVFGKILTPEQVLKLNTWIDYIKNYQH